MKHGHASRKARSAEYEVWAGMIKRCTNPKSRNFERYGGRGISVCERWRDFANFLADMGPRPDGLTIDRINTNGNYEPGNCRWLSRGGQSKNRRSTLLFTIAGETLCVSDWAARHGIHKTTVCSRMQRGETLEQALLGGHRNAL